RGGRFRRWAAAAATIAGLAALAILTVRQTRVWKDSMTLWTHAIQVDPGNGPAWVNRGRARATAGDVPGALADYEAAIALDRGDAFAWELHGLARQRLGDLNGALADYSSAVRAKPDYARAYLD